MPANYTHHRFGKEAMVKLPADAQRLIQRFRRLYNLGLQGPDIFFYHNPLWKTRAGQLGSQYHAMTGRDFFAQVCAYLRKHPSEGGMAYLYGVVGHYCLDSVAHPFVDAHNSDTIGHVEMETEFNRYLMVLDGVQSPQTYNMGRHFKLTRGECVTIAEFYPPATGAAVHSSIRFLRFACRFLAGKHRKLLRAVLRLLPRSISQHFMITPANHKCIHLNEPLFACYQEALSRYGIMTAQVLAHLKEETPLGPEFDAIFG